MDDLEKFGKVRKCIKCGGLEFFSEDIGKFMLDTTNTVTVPKEASQKCLKCGNIEPVFDK